MRLTGKSRPNCWLDAPGWGKIGVVATTLGYGMNIVSSEGEARTKRTFYPWVRTSGKWYIEIEHGNRNERDLVNAWLLFYIARITDPNLTPLPPVSVTVPSRDFHKVGYPDGTIDFGDSYGTGRYSTIVSMTSASDPELGEFTGSRYVPPTDDTQAEYFTPGGSQTGYDPNYSRVYDGNYYGGPR